MSHAFCFYITKEGVILFEFLKTFIARLSEYKHGFASILAFHSVGGAYPFSVDSHEVELFLDFLREHGDFISLDELVSGWDSKKGEYKNSFVLSFDDGHVDNYHFATNILAAKGIPATFFVGAGMFSGKSKIYIDDISRSRGVHLNEQDFMSVNMLMELQKQGFSIQPHGMRHIPFVSMSINEIEEDVSSSIECFIRFGIRPKYLAIPFGRVGRDFNNKHVSLVQRCGLHPLSLSPVAMKKQNVLPVLLPRIGLGNGDKMLWQSKAFGAGRIWKVIKEPVLF